MYSFDNKMYRYSASPYLPPIRARSSANWSIFIATLRPQNGHPSVPCSKCDAALKGLYTFEQSSIWPALMALYRVFGLAKTSFLCAFCNLNFFQAAIVYSIVTVQFD
ncbi:MAG: hypothetical protein ACI9RY_001247 [Reinekea sp.]